MKGSTILAQLRQQAAVARHAKFTRPAIVQARMHVAIEKPVSKQSAKMGRKVRTLRVRNWQINAAHFN